MTYGKIFGLPYKMKLVHGLPKDKLFIKDAEGIKVFELQPNDPEAIKKIKEMYKKADSTERPYVKEYTNMSEEEVQDSLQGISGRDIEDYYSKSPEALIAAATQLFHEIDDDDFELHEFSTFEEVLVATYVKKFHLMRRKQRKYGNSNILDAGLPGIVTRLSDKVQRAKNMVGNPKEQVEAIRAELDKFPYYEKPYMLDIETLVERIYNIIDTDDDPTGEESLEDTFVDAGNYGDIAVMVLNGAFGKPMEDK